MQKTYYILRHSETFVTQSKRIIRWYGFKIFSAHILPLGNPVTEKIAKYLKDIPTDINICSEYLRCRETAEIVSRITHKKFIYDKRVNEFFFETFWHFKKRLRRFNKDMESSDAKVILICTHEAVITTLIAILTGKKITLRSLFSNHLHPGNMIIITGNKVKTIDFNAQEK